MNEFGRLLEKRNPAVAAVCICIDPQHVPGRRFRPGYPRTGVCEATLLAVRYQPSRLAVHDYA
jgi:hypothetical protein